MPLGRGASSKSSRTFGSTPLPKINFFAKIQASSNMLLQSALAAAEWKTKTKNQGDFGQVVFILSWLVLLPESLIQAKENYNCDDKYFKFARAIVCKLFEWKTLGKLNKGKNSLQNPGYLYSNSTTLQRRRSLGHNSGYFAILYWYHFYNFCLLA